MIAYILILRPHQWAKNLIIFVPFLASGKYPPLVSICSFLAWSIIASFGYIINDICDKRADSNHPNKKQRPIASGRLPQRSSYYLLFFLLSLFVICNYWLPYQWLIISSLYLVLTITYSLYLKRILYIGTLCLTSFYLLRLVSSLYLNAHLTWSYWLLGFAFCFFYSLALLKTYYHSCFFANDTSRKPYQQKHAIILAWLGQLQIILSCYIFISYIYSKQAGIIYQQPLYLWGVVVAVFAWLQLLWLCARRQQMHTDIVWFVIKDYRSYITASIIFGFIYLAH